MIITITSRRSPVRVSPSERDNLIMEKWTRRRKNQTAANTNVFHNKFASKLELGLKHVLCVLIRVLKIDREWIEWNSQSRKDWKMPSWILVWLAALVRAPQRQKSLFPLLCSFLWSWTIILSSGLFYGRSRERKMRIKNCRIFIRVILLCFELLSISLVRVHFFSFLLKTFMTPHGG